MAGREMAGATGARKLEPLSGRLDWNNVELIGLVAAVLSPKPYNPLGLYLGVATTVGVFAITFVPVRVRILVARLPLHTRALGRQLDPDHRTQLHTEYTDVVTAGGGGAEGFVPFAPQPQTSECS